MTPEARAEAERLGQLAEDCVPLATELVVLVRDEGRTEIARFLRRLTGEQRTALLVVLAAMVPVDEPVTELLSWVTWDAGAGPAAGAVFPGPGRRREPCGTMAAVRRHRRNREPLDRSCKQADERHSADTYDPQKRRAQYEAGRERKQAAATQAA